MAQVYFIGSIDHKSVKIGMTEDNDAKNRLSQIQTGCPFKVNLIGYIKCHNGKDARLAEKKLHAALSNFRLNGEWFRISPFVESVLAEVEMFGNGEIFYDSSYPSPILSNILQRGVQPKQPEANKDFLIDLLSAALIDANKRNAKMMAAFEVFSTCFDKFKDTFDDSATANFTTNPSDAEKRADILNSVMLEAMHKKFFEPLSADEVAEEFIFYDKSDIQNAVQNSNAYELRSVVSRGRRS